MPRQRLTEEGYHINHPWIGQLVTNRRRPDEEPLPCAAVRTDPYTGDVRVKLDRGAWLTVRRYSWHRTANCRLAEDPS